MKKGTGLHLTVADSDIARCFDAAVHNVADINTVRCRYRRYNKTGLLRYPYMLRAGRCYKTPWTRDASVNTWQAMNFMNPEVSRTTLLAVCDLNKKGEIVIQPDVQEWDQIVWAIGAYNYCLTSGDLEFFPLAHGIISRALTLHRESTFNEKYGLFTGGSFFNDGIAGYPLRCHGEGLKASFAPAHPTVNTLMCLSTNCLYCEAYRIYGELSDILGLSEEAENARTHSEALKSNINKHLWSDELCRYRYILYPDGSTDDSQELSGLAFSLLFGICPEEKQKALFESIAVSPVGTVSIWPPFEGLYSDERPGRHNNVIWPFLNGIMVEAAARCSQAEFLTNELNGITELYKGSKFHFFEIYSPYTKKQFGGWQIGRVWDSCRDQTWSATCYIGGIILGVFGIRAERDGIRFSPCVPEGLKDSELSGIRLRGNGLTVKVKGYGSRIGKFLLDGKECEPFIPWDDKAHTVTMIME